MSKRIVCECPKCKEVKPMTRHHLYPKRFYGNTSEIFMLCRECHYALEKLIPLDQIMPRQFYEIIVEVFLKMEENP